MILRKYQQEAVDAIAMDYGRKLSRVGVILPTGTGKTQIFIELANRYLNKFGDKMALVLSHRSLLTEQTKKRVESIYPDLKIGILQAENIPTYEDRLIIGTMQSTRSDQKLAQWLFGHKYEVGMIIVDEAHFIMCESYKKIFEQFPNAFVVGFTATPYKDSKLMCKYFDKISYSASLSDMIDQGMLVPPKLQQMFYQDETDEGRISHIIALYKEKEIGKKAIVFLKRMEDCETARNAFVMAGIKAKTITCDTTEFDRNNIFKDFSIESGTDVLLTVNVLTEGFDEPKVEVIFMPYKTNSVTQYIQRIGRGLRLCPEINKTECRIYASGNAPEIKKGQFEFLHEMMLGKKITKEELKDVFEELQYMEVIEGDTSSEKYSWTKKVTEIADKVYAMKFIKLGDLISTKQFPIRFMKDLSKLDEAIPEFYVRMPHGDSPMTKNQIMYLMKNGFTKDNMKDFNRNDAATLVHLISNIEKKGANQKWQIKSGQFKGRYVWELPFKYRQIVLDKYPTSEVAEMIRQYKGNKK